MQAYSPLSWPRSSGAVTPQSARRFAEERFLSLWWQESLLPEEEKDEERSPFHIHDDADVEGVNIWRKLPRTARQAIGIDGPTAVALSIIVAGHTRLPPRVAVAIHGPW